MTDDTSSSYEPDDETLREFFPAYSAVKARLAGLAPAETLMVDPAMAFSIIFTQLFLADQPNYKMTDGSSGASRTNWTYHTALAIAESAKVMNFVCKFETLGKRDAVIETKNDPPFVLLVAEWEWDTEDVFGKGKELEKLWKTCRECPDAVAMLLTYCTEPRYPDYLRKVANYWIGTRKRHLSDLYLHAIIYNEAGAFREFKRLRTALIGDEGVQLWGDLLFD